MKQKTWELYSQILSQEGIRLEYSDYADTAFFNLETRVVTIPTFEYMTDDVTQLLVSHEVGHAKYSTYNTSEYQDYIKRFKDLFNVVEDAHIENRIKGDFNGLKSIFKEGYKTLHKEDFFGLSNVSLNSLSLTSRLNLYAKIGHILDIPFEGRENEFAVRLKNVFSKNDVIQLCEDILTFLNERKEKEEDKSNEEGEGSSLSSKTGISIEVNGEGDEEIDAFPENAKDGEGLSSTEDELTDTISSIFEKKKKEYGKEELSSSKPSVSEKYKNVLHLKTKEVFQNAIDYTQYYDLVHETSYSESRQCRALLKEVKNLAKSADTVFQQKKKAEELKNSSNVQVGRLNMKKLSKYKITDNIFKKTKVLKEGKNHGIVILVDFSGSMGKDVLRDAIVQACIVGEFCRMNEIPFAVIAFGVHKIDYSNQNNKDAEKTIAILGHNHSFDLEAILYLISRKESLGLIEFRQADTPTIDGLLTATYIIDGFKKCGVDKTSLYLVTDGFHTHNRFDGTKQVKFSSHCNTLTVDNVLYTATSYIPKTLNHHDNWIIELMCRNLKLRYDTYISINFIGDYEIMIDRVSPNVYSKVYGFDTKSSYYQVNSDYDNFLYLWKHAYYFDEGTKIPRKLKDGILSYSFKNNPFIDQYQFFDKVSISNDDEILTKSLVRIKRLKIFVNGFIERFA